MGEALYATQDSLRHLRRWRFVIACLPVVSLALLATAASKWPKASASDSTSYYEGEVLRDRATKLESKVERLTEEQERQSRLLESAIAATIAVQTDVRLINQKFDLLGWLVSAAIVAILSASAAYFYNIKLRRNLASADLVHSRKATHHDQHSDQEYTD